jgi:hypothetical protein
LIELPVVISIIALLAALLRPVLNKAKQEPQGIQCMNIGTQMAKLGFAEVLARCDPQWWHRPWTGNVGMHDAFTGGWSGIGGFGAQNRSGVMLSAAGRL